jgi:lysozyme family protein
MPIQPSPRFLACMPFIIQEEGTKFSNTPGDHGGATRYGIIQTEYNIFRHSLGLPLQSVNLISTDEYNTIYWQSYWQPHCPMLPAGLDLSVFNINVNGGPGRGTKLLQMCLGISIDGVWAGETVGAVAKITDAKSIIVAFHADERAFYQAIINHDPSQQKFASDWFGRNDRCEVLSLKMAAAPQAVA